MRLGRRAAGHYRAVSAVAFSGALGIALFVFLNVPWDIRMPYEGRYDRSGNGIPMQIALLLILLPLGGFWRAGRYPDAHHLGRAGRIGVYVFLAPAILAFVHGQWIVAKAILAAGGYFAGQPGAFPARLVYLRLVHRRNKRSHEFSKAECTRAQL